MSRPSTVSAAPSRWRPTPGRFLTLLAGLVLFGVGEGLIVSAALGSSPWLVLSQGVARHTPLTVGTATIVIGALVLALWLPLRQRPGLGTVCNVVVVGVVVDRVLELMPDLDAVGPRLALVLLGIATTAVGSGFYLGAALGPGPRDGLMTGLHRVTGRSIALVRSVIEATVCLAGFLLGGTAGIGTLMYVLLIGVAVQLALRTLSRVPAVDV